MGTCSVLFFDAGIGENKISFIQYFAVLDGFLSGKESNCLGVSQ